MTLADLVGWAAAALMVATFGCRNAARMRCLAVWTNVAFIGYGYAAWLLPVLVLHALLLPINVWRWRECVRNAATALANDSSRTRRFMVPDRAPQPRSRVLESPLDAREFRARPTDLGNAAPAARSCAATTAR